jgi:hypothetical protein
MYNILPALNFIAVCGCKGSLRLQRQLAAAKAACKSSGLDFFRPPRYKELMDGLSISELVTRVIKYFLEGLAVAVAMTIIPRKTPDVEEIVVVAFVAAAVFAILDLLSPSIGLTARQGAGFGLGANLVGFPGRV